MVNQQFPTVVWWIQQFFPPVGCIMQTKEDRAEKHMDQRIWPTIKALELSAAITRTKALYKCCCMPWNDEKCSKWRSWSTQSYKRRKLAISSDKTKWSERLVNWFCLTPADEANMAALSKYDVIACVCSRWLIASFLFLSSSDGTIVCRWVGPLPTRDRTYQRTAFDSSVSIYACNIYTVVYFLISTVLWNILKVGLYE